MSSSPGRARRFGAGRGLLPAALLLAAGLAGVGCGDGTVDGGGEARPEARGEADAGSEAAGPLRAFRVRIRNRSGDTVGVVADAGAGAVALDTVGPADSAAVRVETRAGRLEIRARRRPGGRAVRSRYDLERPPGDTLLEFGVPPAPPEDGGG